MSYFRKPRTTSEIRAIPEAGENGVKVRAKRNERHIPNSYDDLQKNKSRPRTDRGKNKRRS